MKFKTEELIADLTSRTEQIIKTVELYKSLPIEQLSWRPGPEKWNVIECLEHLSLYSDFYLPAINNSINGAIKNGPSEFFKSGILGNYFALSMPPREKLNTMNTFKSKNPLGKVSDNNLAIERFLNYQKQTLKLLENAKKVNLTKAKTATTIGKLVKIRLGDTFRVVIYHNERHIVQAQNVLAAQGIV